MTVPATNRCPSCKKMWVDGCFHCGICHTTFANQSDLLLHWDEHGQCRKDKE